VASTLRAWLNPARPEFPAMLTEERDRRAVRIELLIVFAITLGLSGASSLLSYLDGLLQQAALADQKVALNVTTTDIQLIDFLRQLLGVVRLVGWGALGAYLLWRSGIELRRIGFGRTDKKDWLGGVGLAALIGIPGLALYLIAWQLGLNRAVLPSAMDETWWRPIALTLSAIGNALAEELLVVSLLLTRLRQLGVSENRSLLISSVLRGSYHFYQGLGGFVGNVVMGLIFGRVWQKTNRLWPLIIAHALLDIVAFVGYSLLRGVSWLPG
jgi:hypothetical protein